MTDSKNPIWHVFTYRDAELGWGYERTVGIVRAWSSNMARSLLGPIEFPDHPDAVLRMGYGCDEVTMERAKEIKARIEGEIASREKTLIWIEV